MNDVHVCKGGGCFPVHPFSHSHHAHPTQPASIAESNGVRTKNPEKPRKPHSTGIKLYVLGDSVHPFITDIFLYAGKRVRVFRDHPQVAGPRTAREMVHRWADLLPTRTAIVCDSYFGSHLVANQMAQRQQPFLFLCKRDQEGVSLAGDSMRPSIAAETYVKGGKYSLHVYKTQKWVANHHVWFHFCQTVCSTMSGCATEVVMSSHLLWLHTGS